MHGPALRLDAQICFLVHRLDLAILARYRPLLAPLGLTYPQYLAMLVLWERGSSGVTALADRLGLDTGTLSPLLKRLEAAGLVARRRRADDERAVSVELTAAGRELEARAAAVPAALASCLLSGEDEYLRLKSLFADLVARLEEGPAKGT